MSDTNQLLTQIAQKIGLSAGDVDQHSSQLLEKLKTGYSLDDGDMQQLLERLQQIFQKSDPTQALQQLYDTYFLSNDRGRDFTSHPTTNQQWFYDQIKDSAPWTIDYAPSGSYGEAGSPLKLYARYLARPSYSNKTVIVSHGMWNNSLNMGDFANVFYSLGYNVLAPDARGYGLSSDPNRNLGIFDSDDVLKWVDLLVQKDPKVEVVLFGGSMGASTTLQSSYKNKSSAVKAIIEDCGHSQLNKFMKYVMQQPGHPTSDFNDVEIFTVLLAFDQLLYSKQGVILADGLTEAGLATATLPILTIHGTGDKFIPPQDASIISSLVNTDIKYEHRYFDEGAPHYGSVNVHPEVYIEQVKSFLDDVANPTPPDPSVHISTSIDNVKRNEGSLSFTATVQQVKNNTKTGVGNFDIIISSNATMSSTIIINPLIDSQLSNPPWFMTTEAGTCDIVVTFPTDPTILSLLEKSQVTVRRMYHGQQNDASVGLIH